MISKTRSTIPLDCWC